MSSGILCQVCGVEAPTRKVAFHQNIGMLVMRKHQTVAGNLCKTCINKKFWSMTATTLFLGPWGYISLVISPFFIVFNVARYLGTLGMPAVPADAKVPVLDQTAIDKLAPLSGGLVDRLNTGEKLFDVANEIAVKAKVTPGQVVKYVIALSQQHRQSLQPAYGFPVQPLKAPSPGGGPPPLPGAKYPAPKPVAPLPVSADEDQIFAAEIIEPAETTLDKDADEETETPQIGA